MKAVKQPEVIIYSTPTCHYCKIAKESFKEWEIQYTEYDVSTDIGKRAEMIEKSGGMSVPVIDIDGSIFVGWDEELFKKIFQSPARESRTQKSSPHKK